jgi:hypothetical protein
LIVTKVTHWELTLLDRETLWYIHNQGWLRVSNSFVRDSTMSMLPLPPTLQLALVQLERRFRRILTHIQLLFNIMMWALKSGHPEKYRAALVALREMNIYIKLLISTTTRHLPILHVTWCIHGEGILSSIYFHRAEDKT